MTNTVTLIRPPVLVDLRSARDAQSYEDRLATAIDRCQTLLAQIEARNARTFWRAATLDWPDPRDADSVFLRRQAGD